MANDDTSSYLWGTGELLSLIGLLADGYTNYENIDAQAQDLKADWDFTKSEYDYAAGERSRQNADMLSSTAARMYGATGASGGVQAGAIDADMKRQADMGQRQLDYQKGKNDRAQAALSRAQTRNTVSTALGGIGQALGAVNSIKENNWFGAMDENLKGTGLSGMRGAQYQYNNKKLWG